MPNPNNGYFTVQVSLPEITDLKIDIYSENGGLIIQNSFRNRSGVISQEIDLTRQAKGLYNVVATIRNQQITRKIIVQ